MVKLHRSILLVVLGLCLAGLVACDSSNGGGGGTTPATGYTQADLAGRWNFVQTGIWAGKGYLVIDASGKVTEAVIRYTGDDVPMDYFSLGKGSFTVSADGKVHGDFIWRGNYTPPAGSYWLLLRGFRLRFTSAAKVEGDSGLSQAWFPAGVYRLRLVIGTHHITMEKQ